MTNTGTMLNNPITRAVAALNERIATLDADAIARLEDAATLDAGDWLSMGDVATRAMLADIIDQDTAQAIHSIHTRFRSDATLAERTVLIMVMGEILPALMAKGG